MANGSVNFNMQFNADTAQAKKQIQDLQQSLTELTNIGTKGDSSTFLTKSMADAQVKANQLKVSLQEAFNVNTGKLDLTKFSESLKKSGITLEEYRKSLSTLGPEGQKAFVSLANAISTSEVPLKRTSKLMQDLGTTMKNTVKWQLSSSAMHGFMSAVSQAWNYAKDLNESLNNIRIVTGQNTDQMAAFAQQANAAAKALSTTTTKYTDASLIYYQQGLDDKEVQDRTNTTIKLANVSRQSVEESADQMTTIWNNYADGSKELEYYADVLVKLGAATASSSEEIATGISKFAAVGETVGLTYEYATAALATVTATTRQSADTVGTAFKTLFARIQDLELGKILEDGTDLGQYSQALEKVGINIKTTSGEVKDMNTILDEMGEKWTTLGKDEQIALAQNVAGVRQYTQLMALMNNWDFFKENVATASGASGALEEQQEIYAESWEAAGKRVKASLEDVYDSLINDEAIIKATDAIGKLIDGIGAFVDSIGGAKGVLLALGAVLVNVFSKQVGANIDNIITKIKMLTPSGQKQAQQLKYDAVNSLQQQAREQGNNNQGQALKSSYENQAKIQQQIIDNSEKFTAAELERAQALQKEVAEYGAINAEKAKAVDLANSELENQKILLEATREVKTERLEATKNQAGQQLNDVNKEIDLYGTEAYEEYIQMRKELDEARSNGSMDESTYSKEVQALKQMAESMDSQVTKVAKLKQQQTELNNIIEETNVKLKAMGSNTSIEEYTEQLKNAAIAEQQVADISEKMKAVNFNEDETLSQDATHQLEDYVASLMKLENLSSDVAEKVQKLNQELQSANPDTHKIYEYAEELGQIPATANSATTTTNLAEQALRNFGLASGLSEEQITNLINSIYQCVNAETEFSATQTALAQKMQQTSITISNFGKSISTIGTKMSSFASTASNLAMVGMSFKSLKETLTDDSLSGMEKLLSSLMSIGMLGGSLGPLLNNMGESISALGKKALTAAGESSILSGGLFGEASAATTATGATATFGATLASVLLPIAAVAAAVVGLKLLFNFITELNSVDLSKTAESAQELAKTSKEDFDKASTKVQNFTSDLEELSTKYKTLEGLTRGTDEWNTALQDVNTTVLSLLSTYPELASTISNVNGILIVDMEQQNAILQQLQEEQAKKGAGYYANQIQSTQLNQQYQAQTLQDTIGAQSETGFFSNNKFSQDFQNAANRGTTSDLFNKIISEISAGRISKDSSEQQIADTLGIEITKESESFISSIKSNIDALTEYANSLSANAGLIDTYTQQMNESFLATSKSFQESENQAALAASLSKDIQEAKDQWKNEQDGFTQTTAAQYLQSQGLDWTKNKASIDKDGKLTYTGADNKETTVELDAQILEYLATINATLSEEQIQDQEQENSKIANSGNAVAAGFGDQMLGVESGLTEGIDLTGYTREEMDAIDDYINDSNNEISDAVKNAYETAREENTKTRQDTTSRIMKTLGTQVSSLTNASTETQKKLVDNYEDSFKQAGEKGAQALNKALEGLDDDTLQQVGAALDDVDWSGGDGLIQLKEKLSDIGVEIDLTSETWLKFASIMENTSFVTVDNLKESLSSLMGIVKDLSIGDIISDKDYQKLVSSNSLLKEFFSETYDGWKFKGGIDLGAKVFDSFLNKAEKAKEAYQELSSWDFDNSIVGKGFQSGSYDEDRINSQISLIQNRDNLSQNDQDAINSAIKAQGLDGDYVNNQLSELESALAENPDLDLSQMSQYTDVLQPIIELLQQTATGELDTSNEAEHLTQVMLNSVSTLAELDQAASTLNATTNQTREGLISLTAGNENCVTEYEALNAAIASGNEAQAEAAELSLRIAERSSEQAAQYDLEAQDVKSLANAYKEMGEAGIDGYEIMAKDAEAATDAAVRYIRLNNGVSDLADNYDDYAEVLKNVKKASSATDKAFEMQTDTGKKLKKSLADVLDTSEDLIDAKLVNAIDPKTFKKAADGDITAIESIRKSFVKMQAEANGIDFSGLQNELDNLKEGEVITLDADTTPFLYALIQAKVNAGADAAEIQELLSGFNLDADVTDLVNALDAGTEAVDAYSTNFINKTSFSSEVEAGELEQTLPQTDVGFTETIEAKPVESNGDAVLETGAAETHPIKQQVTQFKKTVIPNEVSADETKNTGISSVKTTNGSGEAGASKGVSIKNLHKSTGNAVSPSNKGKTSGGGSGGGGGGGGSSSPAKKVQKTKFTDIGERYHTITNKIDDQVRATEKLTKLEERLYGKNKLDAMQQEIKSLERQNELIKQKRKEAEAYLVTDKKELEDQVSNWNSTYGTTLTVQYDEDGNIENYREIVESIVAVKNDWEDKLNAMSTQEEQNSDENQEYQEALDNNSDAIMDAISQYEETDSLIEELDDTIEDNTDAIMSRNFDIWQGNVDIIFNKFERYQKTLENTNKLLGIVADNIYTSTKYLTSKGGTLGQGGQFSGGEYGAALDALTGLIGKDATAAYQNGQSEGIFDIAKQDKTSAVGSLYAKHDAGEITDAAFVEGLETLQDKFISLGETIVEIDETMQSGYADALSDAQERMERYTRVIDNSASRLDHLNNLLDLSGQQNNYEKKGIILQGQADVAKSSVDANKSRWDLAQSQWEQVSKAWDSMNDEQKEKYKQTYDAAWEEYDTAMDNYYSSLEDFAEKTKAVAQNQLDATAKIYNEMLLGEGKSWDAVSTQLDRYSSIGEEYLTKTNQIYEVTKLTRKVQSDIDNTSNTAAKKRLETFKKQTEELGKQGELTEYEMELQNKKYELLQAELAMEEQANTKSQVRLTRDSEGNYSYTYTTDEEEMQQAEDEYLQKQNDLYNYLLEGSNDYYTKYVQSMQEATETFKSINEAYLNGEIESEEEYHRQMLEAQQYYNNIMETYKNLYNVSMAELGDQCVDSWTTQEGLIIEAVDRTKIGIGDSQDEMIDKLGDTVSNIAEKGGLLSDTWKTFTDNFITYTEGPDGSLTSTLGNFDATTSNEEQAQAGYWGKMQTSIEGFKDNVKEPLKEVTGSTEDLTETIGEVKGKAEEAAQGIDTLTTQLETQLTSVNNIVAAWSKYAEQVNLVRETLAKLQAETATAIDYEEGDADFSDGNGPDEDGGSSDGGDGPGGGDGGDNPEATDELAWGIAQSIWTYGTRSGWGNDPIRSKKLTQAYSEDFARKVQQYINQHTRDGSLVNFDSMKYSSYQLIGYDTGGYTGEWENGNEDGRIALLHQKELVLNENDTSNMLQTVSVIRDIIKALDLNAMSTAIGSLSNLNAGSAPANDKESLEQDIHIEANFPNATNKDEIQEAFLGLADLASQYANRK